VTDDSGIVTADSGKEAEIGHDETVWPVTNDWNGRSRRRGIRSLSMLGPRGLIGRYGEVFSGAAVEI